MRINVHVGSSKADRDYRFVARKHILKASDAFTHLAQLVSQLLRNSEAFIETQSIFGVSCRSQRVHLKRKRARIIPYDEHAVINTCMGREGGNIY